MKRGILLSVGLLLLGTVACENSCVKSFGGTMTVELPTKSKLLGVTWKGDNLWYLVRPMRDGENPEYYTFQEKSVFGSVEGQVVLKESP